MERCPGGQPPFGPSEAEIPSRTLSPSAQRVYGVARVCQELHLAPSTFYAAEKRKTQPEPSGCKRGPRGFLSDTELTSRIRVVLEESPFVGEGHRKVWARLRFAGIRTSRNRVLRLMREAGLLAPARACRVLGPRNHDGRIITESPDRMWGTHLTSTVTLEDAQVAVFIAVDHCTAECVGIHAAKTATRFEALEPIRQRVRSRFGGFESGRALTTMAAST